ncbi:hypothetical protein [Alicyclobacillus sendaiensis]|uniref:hypothetical protein n=1 Tax=Alicyclobacillus sendaiensis TaxID=192387 RepID=UPI0026F43688|nr:hypothetical protein [Alicyclobacillus sendaiensis]
MNKTVKILLSVGGGVVLAGVLAGSLLSQYTIELRPVAKHATKMLAPEREPLKIPPFHYQTPDIYPANIETKVIDIAPTAKEVIFYSNQEFGGSSVPPTEQVYTVNPATDKWQMIYTNTISKLQGEFMEAVSKAPIGNQTYAIATMWGGGTGESVGIAELIVVDTKHDKVLYANQYQHNTLTNHLIRLSAAQTQSFVNQWGSSHVGPKTVGVAVLGATSGDVLYFDDGKVEDVPFYGQDKVAQLTLPAGKYIIITPASDLSGIDSIQGNYVSFNQATFSSPATLTVKTGTYIVFNDINTDQYSVYTNMWNPGPVQEDNADMVNGGITPPLQPGLWSFVLASYASSNQGLLLEVHVES